MSFDRSDLDRGDAVDVSGTADVAREAPRRPAREEQVESHWRARETALAAYAAWDRANGGRGTVSPAGDEASRERAGELEADKAARDRQFAIQDAKLAAQARIIAEQSERIDRLESYIGQITTAVRELRQARDEPDASAGIAGRARGGETELAESKEPQHKRRMPTDTVNNVISVAAGAAITDLAYHLGELPPEVANLGASGVMLSAGIIAVWRERRKAKDDADHRPDG
jgi:hypothetical protein